MTEPNPPGGTSPMVSPLDRFTGGGWRRGILRLALGLVFLSAVLYFAPGDSLNLLLSGNILPWVAAGVVMHLLQRVARISKWRLMITAAPLRQRSLWFLMRVQFIGMLANLLLPVSEALKVWAVARERRDIPLAAVSIAADTALHATLIGVVGAVGLALGSSAALVSDWCWISSGALVAGGLLVVLLLRRWPRRARGGFQLNKAVWGWCAIETMAQAAVYSIALNAVNAGVPLLLMLAYVPLLFTADLAMLTPSGVGVREGVFGLVLQLSGAATVEVSVASGLLVSAILLASAVVGGGLALAWPASEQAPATGRHSSSGKRHQQ